MKGEGSRWEESAEEREEPREAETRRERERRVERESEHVAREIERHAIKRESVHTSGSWRDVPLILMHEKVRGVKDSSDNMSLGTTVLHTLTLSIKCVLTGELKGKDNKIKSK